MRYIPDLRVHTASSNRDKASAVPWASPWAGIGADKCLQPPRKAEARRRAYSYNVLRPLSLCRLSALLDRLSPIERLRDLAARFPLSRFPTRHWRCRNNVRPVHFLDEAPGGQKRASETTRQGCEPQKRMRLDLTNMALPSVILKSWLRARRVGGIIERLGWTET